MSDPTQSSREPVEFPEEAYPRSGEGRWLTTDRPSTSDFKTSVRHIFKPVYRSKDREELMGYDSLCGRIPGVIGRSLVPVETYELAFEPLLTGYRLCARCASDVNLEAYVEKERLDAVIEAGEIPIEGDDLPLVAVERDAIDVDYAAHASVEIDDDRVAQLRERLADE